MPHPSNHLVPLAAALLVAACMTKGPAAVPPATNPTLAPAPGPPPRAGGEFEADMQSLTKTLQPVLAKAGELAEAGKLQEADELILNAIPQDQWNGVHYFIFGNLFFAQRDDLADRYLRQAYRAYPEEARTNLEYALILHRQGRCEEALPLYEVALALEGMPPQWNALKAECLLKAGKAKEATLAWAKASYETARSAIDFAVHAVHGEVHPIRRWYALRQRIAAGELDQAAALIHLDIHWNTDWWNSKRQQARLERDLSWLATQSGMDAGELQALHLYADLTRGKHDGKTVRTALEQAGIVLGQAARLPKNGLLTKALLVTALEHGATTQEELLAHGPELERRSREEGDPEALSALSYLSSKRPVEERLAIEQRGWERHTDPRFGIGVLTLQASMGQLDANSKLLANIRESHLNEALVQVVALELAIAAGKNVAAAYVDAARAEFTSLSPGLSMVRSCDRLNALMHGLREELGVPLPPPPTTALYRFGTTHTDGQRLQLVVETYLSFKKGRSRHIKDLRGYLVTVDLSKTDGQVEILGPLWEVAGERSALSYEAGAMYSEQDRALAAVHPRFAFDNGGRLIVWKRDDPESARALDLGGAQPSWVPVPRSDDPFAESLVEPLRVDRIHGLHKGKSGWRLVHGPTRSAVRDPWLERVARDLEQRMARDLGSSHIQLDADRKHLFLFPTRSWEKDKERSRKLRAEGRGPELVRTFHLGNRVYERGDYGLLYSRPRRSPVVFKRSGPRTIAGASAILEMAGRPHLLIVDDEQLELLDANGKQVHLVSTESMPTHAALRARAARYDPFTATVRITASWFVRGAEDFAHTLGILDWNLKDGTLTTRELSPRRYLRLHEGEMVPVDTARRSALPY